MNKILITGGAGYIGSKLTTKLVNLKYQVTVIDSLNYEKNSLNHLKKNKKFKFIRGDVRNKKLGTFGLISNFSFYYAHHMSTIEGGMICTNNKKIYQISRMLRSHGMLREIGDRKIERKIIKK